MVDLSALLSKVPSRPDVPQALENRGKAQETGDFEAVLTEQAAPNALDDAKVAAPADLRRQERGGNPGGKDRQDLAGRLPDGGGPMPHEAAHEKEGADDRAERAKDRTRPALPETASPVAVASRLAAQQQHAAPGQRAVTDPHPDHAAGQSGAPRGIGRPSSALPTLIVREGEAAGTPQGAAPPQRPALPAQASPVALAVAQVHAQVSFGARHGGAVTAGEEGVADAATLAPGQPAAIAEQTSDTVGAPAASLPVLADALAPAPARGPEHGIAVAARVPDPAQDFATLVDRLVAAQEAVAPATVETVLDHADFGPVSLRFRTGGEGLSVAMSSHDPDFARIAQAALPALSAAGTSAASADTGTQGQPAPTHHAQTRGESAARQDGSSAFAGNGSSRRQRGESSSRTSLASGQPDASVAAPRGGIFA